MDLVFVQPGAKINSVFYCWEHRLLKQGLPPGIHCTSNNDFVFQDGVPAHCSHHTVAYLHSNVPEFTEPENWLPNSLDLNLADYSVWGALQQTVYCHKISDTDQLKQVLIDSWAQLSQDTLFVVNATL